MNRGLSFTKFAIKLGYLGTILSLLSFAACDSSPIGMGEAADTSGSSTSQGTANRSGFVFGGNSSAASESSIDVGTSENDVDAEQSAEVSALGIESAQVEGSAAYFQSASESSASSLGAEFDGGAASGRASCERLLLGPPRGLACLHCLHPKAQGQAEVIASILRRSCLKNVAINYLVDGTFSFDENFLLEQIASLSDAGRNLSLVFYLGNGPAQRRHSTTRINGFGAKISPEDFRSRILSDTGLQAQYQRLVARLLPIIRFARQNRGRVYLVPILEDNLDDRSFEKLFELTLDVLGSDSQAAVVRNPCGYACYDGNTVGLPDGVGDEAHIMVPPINSEAVIVTNDGRDYSSPAKGTPGSAVISLADLSSLRDAARDKGIVFILWDAGRQGLPADYESTQFALPQDRNYLIPSYAEQDELISFLRGGL
jgi:hypothetical protein